MLSQQQNNYTVLRYSSLLFAIVLTILPLPDSLEWCRPCWVPLTFLYWLIVHPHMFGLTTIWLVGIALDTLLGTRLGEHAIALLVVCFITIKVHRDVASMDYWRQLLSIGALLLLYQCLIFAFQVFFRQYNPAWFFWLPALTSMVIWSALMVTIRYMYTPRMGVY